MEASAGGMDSANTSHRLHRTKARTVGVQPRHSAIQQPLAPGLTRRCSSASGLLLPLRPRPPPQSARWSSSQLLGPRRPWPKTARCCRARRPQARPGESTGRSGFRRPAQSRAARWRSPGRAPGDGDRTFGCNVGAPKAQLLTTEVAE